jgi:hypothetical protein
MTPPRILRGEFGKPFDMVSPLIRLCIRLDDLTAKHGPKVPEPASELLASLQASLRARGVALPNEPMARRIEIDTGCKVGRAVPTAEGLITLCDQLERALDSLLGAGASIAVDNGLGNIWSPSQRSTLVDCEVRWWFKYGVGLPERSNGNLAIGRSVHTALAHNFRAKAATGQDLPEQDVVAAFDAAWTEESDAADFRNDEDPAELASTSQAMVQKFMREIAPGVFPAIVEIEGQKQPAVELEVAGEIGGVPVRGRVDLVDVAGTIHDWKTSGRKPAGITSGQRFQLSTYRQLAPAATGKATVPTMVRTKTLQLVQNTIDVTEADILETAKGYPLARDAVKAGIFQPNRGSNLCSKRNCTYWRECEAEYGGLVEAS